MTDATPPVTCRHCHVVLAATHQGPCPKCGGQGKDIPVSGFSHMELTDSVGWQSHREFYENNPLILAIVGLLTVASAGIGLVVEGAIGAAIGLALGLVSFFLSPKGVMLVRERRQG